jgi:hypothetical protein
MSNYLRSIFPSNLLFLLSHKMESIHSLTIENFQEIVYRIDFTQVDQVFNTISMFIDNAPFMARVVSFLIEECCFKNKAFDELFRKHFESKSGIPDIDLSRCIYASYLGARTNISEISKVSNTFSSISITSDELKNYENNLEIFYSFAILKHLSFNKKICTEKLMILNPTNVIKAIIRDQSPFNISILIQTAQYLDFLEIIAKSIDQLTLKNEIIACIFINFFSSPAVYYQSGYGERLENSIMKRLIKGDALEFCLKVADREMLGRLLNENFECPCSEKISIESFKEMNFKSKGEFFDAFLKLTSPSISHFLSYLEMFKQDFKLNETERAELLDSIKKFHSQNVGYLTIALGKLVEFGIVNSKE